MWEMSGDMLRGARRVWRNVRGPRSSAPGRPGTTPVDRYWGEHTVNSQRFETAQASRDYLEWRFAQYPLFREFMQLWGSHDEEVILDYGCGPGDDVIGFLLYTQACRVIGVDVSKKALRLAGDRLRLHSIRVERVELIQSTDASGLVPLPDASVDYVHCGGVLHHTSDPLAILREFRRVLRPGGRASVMVYNRQSLWFHLYTAYIRMIVEGVFARLTVEEAFARNTDGEQCPIARCYAPDEFVRFAAAADFDAEFVGGYLSLHELSCWREHGSAARDDIRLAPEHRAFLRSLTFDVHGYPLIGGKHAGIGGVYRLSLHGERVR